MESQAIRYVALLVETKTKEFTGSQSKQQGRVLDHLWRRRCYQYAGLYTPWIVPMSLMLPLPSLLNMACQPDCCRMVVVVSCMKPIRQTCFLEDVRADLGVGLCGDLQSKLLILWHVHWSLQTKAIDSLAIRRGRKLDESEQFQNAVSYAILYSPVQSSIIRGNYQAVCNSVHAQVAGTEGTEGRLALYLIFKVCRIWCSFFLSY